LEVVCNVYWVLEGLKKQTVENVKLVEMKEPVPIPPPRAFIEFGDERFEVLFVNFNYSKRVVTLFVETGLESWYFSERDMKELIQRLQSLYKGKENEKGTV